MVARREENPTVLATDAERTALRAVHAMAADSTGGGDLRLIGPAGDAVAVPASVVRLLRLAAAALAEGDELELAPIPELVPLADVARAIELPEALTRRLLDAKGMTIVRHDETDSVVRADFLALRASEGALRALALIGQETSAENDGRSPA